MKPKIIAAAILILSISLFAACADKEENKPTTTAVQTVPTTAATTVTEVPTTVEVTETTTVPTTAEPTTAETTAKETTVRATELTETEKDKPLVTEKGRVYSEKKIVKADLKYGVIFHKYKPIYYQLIDGERHDCGSEYTGYTYYRRGYSATYKELLPAAKENRETYSDYIDDILKIINGYRAEKGVAPLRLNEKLTVMSCVRAEEIAWSGVQGHTRPDGTKCFTIFKEAGFEKGKAGENLGYGFWTPEEVCQAWKDSRTHYENLMNPAFVEIGIGVAADPDENRKLVWSTHFLSDED